MSNRKMPAEMDTVPGDRVVRSITMIVGFAAAGGAWAVIAKLIGWL